MKYYGITDRGLIRKNNQDSYVIASNEARDVFAIVADGIGGNLGGDIASRMAVSHFSKASLGNTSSAPMKYNQPPFIYFDAKLIAPFFPTL